MKNGEIYPSGIGRGRKRTTEKSLELLINYIKDSGKEADAFSIAVGFGYDIEEGTAFRDHALEVLRFSLAVGYGYDQGEGTAFRDHALSVLQSRGYDIREIPTYQIGATIGVHTGPYPLGFGVIEKAL